MEGINGSHLRQLVERRDQLLSEIEALRQKIAGLDIAIQLLSAKPKARMRVSAKGRVAQTIVTLLGESGEAGLDPKAIVERAAGQGIDLNLASVYVLLHRMVRDGSVLREDRRYKLNPPRFENGG